MNLSQGQANKSTDAIYKKIMPSMFHRRVFVFAILSVLLFAGLAAQLIYLTTVKAESGYKLAEGMLIKSRYIPTSRGQITDRNGRVLAEDIPSYDLSVHFTLLNTRWASSRAKIKAKKEVGRTKWFKYNFAQREKVILKYLPIYQEKVDKMWAEFALVSGKNPEELEALKNKILKQAQNIGGAVSKRNYDRMRKEVGANVDYKRAITKVREETQYYPVLQNITSQDVVKFKHKIASADKDSVWSKVQMKDARLRIYPEEEMDLSVDLSTFPRALRSETPKLMKLKGVGFRIIGRMTAALKEDFNRKPFNKKTALGGYRTGDQKGIWGIEQTQENYLRGKRGYVTKNLDTGGEKRVEPIKGKGIQTTIDIVLQARVQALMDPEIGLMMKQHWHADKHLELGANLNGAAVILDARTSEVLAAVSVPGISREQLANDPDSVFNYLSKNAGHLEKEKQPILFRPTQKSYAPGSIVKPLVYNMAVAEGEIPSNKHIKCNGHYRDDETSFRCWIYKQYHGSTHGMLGPVEAIQRSCNIYFYSLGDRLGPHRIVHWYKEFGLRQTDYKTGLPRDHRGNILRVMNGKVKRKIPAGEGILMGIGQGAIDWTPLHAASAYATLGRGGLYISPTFIKNGDPKDRVTRDLHLDPQAVKNALAGLYAGANKQGGSTFKIRNTDYAKVNGGYERIFNIKGVRVMAKSGTASADFKYRYDANKDGVINRLDPVEYRDHGWVVALVQKPGSTSPDYVVAVVVDYGGSGGKSAGPIVNQILYAMQEQGYLPKEK